MSLRSKLSGNISRQLPTLKKLRNDNKGVAAIEFAFIAPVMIGLYFGMSEIAMGIMADRDVSHATAVSADLSTQLPTYNAEQIADIMTATVAVLNVPDSKIGEVSIEINSFMKLTDGTIQEVGYARLGPQISAGGPANYDASGLSDEMFNANSGVVVARLNYKYTPTTFKFMDNMTLSETLVMKPRKSINVPFDDGGANRFTCNVGADRVVNCTVSA